MKIPTSSSILLATLAMSSSSSCLAAPAGGAHQDTGLTSSSSNSHVSSILGSAPRAYPAEMDMQERPETVAKRTLAYPGRLEARDPTLQGVITQVGNILHPILQKLLPSMLNSVKGTAGAKSMDADGANPNQNIDPQDLAALHSAINEVSRLLNANATSGLPVPSQGQGVAGTVTPIVPLSNDDGSFSSSSAAPTGSAAAAADDGPTPNTASASFSSASASASSPPMPGNPPNTPSPPSLPINPSVPV